MKENEEQMENGEEEQIYTYNNLFGQNSNINSSNLHTVESIIGNDEEKKLRSLSTVLIDDSSFYDYDSSSLTLEEANDVQYNSYLPTIIFNIKDFTFIFFLLICSCFNYDFLYLPFIFLGILLSFCLYSNSKQVYQIKKFSEFFGIIYSLILLIFKIILIVLTKKDNKFVLNHRNIFINLGIKLLKDKEETIYLVATILGNSLLLVFSIISYIITKSFVDYNLNENINEKLTEKEMSHLVKKNIIINYFIILGLAIFNTCILSFVYIFLINILLLLMAKHYEIRKLAIFFKLINLFIYVLLILQIFFINFFNTYHFIDILSSSKVEDRDAFYSIYTQLGFILMPNNIDVEKILFHITGYAFIIISLISFASSNNKISFFIINNIIKDKNVVEEDEDEENYNKVIRKIVLKIKEYFTSPNFILHICRGFAIGYLYFFRNFFAIIIFCWLFFSFLFLHINSNKKLTYAVIVTLLVSLFCLHISNIDGFFEKNEKVFSVFDVYHFCLKKINNDNILEYNLYYLCCNLFYFFLILFIYSLFESDIKRERKSKQEMIKKSIINIENKEENKDETVQKIDLEENLISSDKENKDSKDSSVKNEEENLDINNEDILKEDILRERRVTQQILSKKEDKNESEKSSPPKVKLDDELLKKITLLNIITKTFLKHIDKISLVVMYFVAINSINIIHAILVIIFMIQLLFPLLIEVISNYLIIITQLLYFIQFIIDIFKHYYLDSFNNNENFIELFMNYNKDKTKTSVEIFIYGIVYCFYIQYTLYNNEVYKEIVLDDVINLSNYIEIKCIYYPKLKKIFFFIGRAILEIYIWILISLFIFFDSYFEISILFEIKLIIFFIIIFQFLVSIQKSEKHRISLILNWIFLIYSSVNTILVYGYQIICLKYFKKEDSNNSDIPNTFYNSNNTNSNTTDDFFSLHLPSIGFSEYPEDLLYLKFLSHFVCNFISILFIWEMKRISLKSNNIDINNDDNSKIEIQIEDEKEKEKNENEDDEDEEEIAASQQYEKNRNEMNVLNLSYYFFNIILLITKFYWLFLFLVICIIFTKYDLSIILSLYILIFGITFIRMFYQIITKLTNFVKKKSFFLSRLLRYNLIEEKMHVQQNKYYRSIAFHYLLWLSFFSYLLFYSYGVFYLFQKGCDSNEFKGCDERHKPIVSEENELLIQSWVYLIGFYVNTQIDSVFKEAWYHLFFVALISFDVYVQKLENYINEKVEENRKKYRYLANENIKLKPLTFGEDNILMKIGHKINEVEQQLEKEKEFSVLLRSEGKKFDEPLEDINTNNITNNDNNNNTNTTGNRLRGRRLKGRNIKKEEKQIFKYDIKSKNETEEEEKGKKIIEQFLKIFEKAGSRDVKLSSTNYKYQIIKILKQIIEEIIIFLLICTSISKMNIWSIIYMLISFVFIATEKSMMKYYLLYCFMIVSNFIQSVIFVTNLQPSTDPYPDLEILVTMNEKLKLPWYKVRKKYTDKLGFFYGLGVSDSQINLIWMEFIEIVIIYIYLDYFSYCIYEDKNTIGRSKNKVNKINYYNLYLNKETCKIAQNLSQDEYDKHKICMKYNFDIDILDYKDFIKYMNKGGVNNSGDEEKDKILETGPEIPRDTGTILISGNSNDNNELIDTDENIQNNIYERKTNDDMKEEKNEYESPLLKKLMKSRKEATSMNILEKSKAVTTTSSGYFSLLKDFVYLSFHNVILIIIITISMMISSLFSIIYITYSLYFLITSTSIYLGNKYSYPRRIKKILRMIILFDITIQILYQSPLINSDAKEDKDNFDFGKLLQMIGLNKILTFKHKEETDNSSKDFQVVLDYEQLALVIAKAITYLFMSFQILVYNSQDFQEYYLSYIITKNNNLQRIAKMNAFQFNNNRIEAMNKSINFRQDMSQSMNKLKNKLEEWNRNLMKAKADGRLKQSTIILNKQKAKTNEKKDEKVNNIGYNFLSNLSILAKEKKEKEKDTIEKIEEKPIEEEEEETNKNQNASSLKLRLLQAKFKKQVEEEEQKKKIEEYEKLKLQEENDEDKEEEDKKEEDKEEEDKKEEDKKEEDQKEEDKKEEDKIEVENGRFFANIGLPIPKIKDIKKIEENQEEEKKEDEKKEEYLPEKEVYEKIKGWILGGFLIQLQIKIHKYASNYTSIEKNGKYIYERDTIQGKTKITSFIENMVDAQLSTMNLSCFTKAEMNEVKTFFDGSRAKKLQELKKEKEKKKKFQKAGDKIIQINRLMKSINNKNINRETTSSINDKIEFREGDKNIKKDEFKVKNIGVLDEVKRQQKKEEEKRIDLNQPKFKSLENLLSGKLFVKYLSKSYIIKSIVLDILSSFSNNFHWLCYFVMILDHMMTSTLLTMFYPLSIFCYALLEYPRPKKIYWTICLLYTVILLGGKFTIHLEFFKYIPSKEQPLTYYLNYLHLYKIGFKIYNSSFSKEFLEYVIYDALVLIFLLINDYLLVSRGIWNSREQEIENIYQAMERIAKTRDLKLHKIDEIIIFNNSYLDPNKKKLIKSDKGMFKFSTSLGGNSLKDKKFNLSKSIAPKGYNMTKTKTDKTSLKTKIKNNEDLKKEQRLKALKKLELEDRKREIDEKKEREEKYNETKRKYYEKLFPKIRNEKPGGDFYASYTLSMLILIIFILIFYTTMVQDRTFGAVELDTKQFSGAMVLVLLIHVGILLYDRILYISQNRNNIKYDYILYNKITKRILNEKNFNDLKSFISSKYPDIKRETFMIPVEFVKDSQDTYNIIYIQKEELNLPLVQKYLLHIVIVIMAHLFIFFYCPMKGNLNIRNSVYCIEDEMNGDNSNYEENDSLEVQCNDFLTNKALIFFYIFYIIYFLCSGLQIKYGFNDMRRKSMLKSGTSWVNGTIYNAYKSIPFLYEIKLAIDWTFTKTCLDLFQWNKFESVYDIVYCTFCDMNAKNQQKVGEKKGKLIKITMGGALSFILIFILIAPLMLFSSLNPTNQLNNLTGATLKVDLSFVYKNGAVKNYSLYENSKPESIDSIFRDSKDWVTYNYSKSPKTKNFPKNQIQTVQFFNESDKNWDLARPHIEKLTGLILNRTSEEDLEYISLVIDYNFDRPLPAESMKISKRYGKTIYYYNNATDEQNEKLNKIGNALSNCYNESIILENIYSPPIRLSANIKPKRLIDEKYFPNLDIRLGFEGCRNESISTIPEEEDKQEKEEEEEKEEGEKEEGQEEENTENTENEINNNNNEENKNNLNEILKEENNENEGEQGKENEGESGQENEGEGEKKDYKNENVKASYLESYFTFQKIFKKDDNVTEAEGIKFHVFSDQVSTTTSGKNILTFYVSFVLLVGTYVRNFFAGQPEKIMLTEMPYSEEIINLCEGIKVSRNSFDFEQEEKLYYILIEIMRSPEYLRTLTRSSTEQFRLRQELTKASTTTDDI